MLSPSEPDTPLTTKESINDIKYRLQQAIDYQNANNEDFVELYEDEVQEIIELLTMLADLQD